MILKINKPLIKEKKIKNNFLFLFSSCFMNHDEVLIDTDNISDQGVDNDDMMIDGEAPISKFPKLAPSMLEVSYM